MRHHGTTLIPQCYLVAILATLFCVLVPACCAYSPVCYVRESLLRVEASNIINHQLYPDSQLRKRMNVGDDDQGLAGTAGRGAAIDVNDSRLTLTYHEFPLESLDALLDLAAKEYNLLHESESESSESESQDEDDAKKKSEVFVDVGSGCGRLVLYESLINDGSRSSSGSDSTVPLWKEVHGIEIGTQMHEYAVERCQQGLDEKYLISSSTSSDTDDDSILAAASSSSCSVHFHVGPAGEFADILSKADILFCYSTAFPSDEFNPELGAMILTEEWSNMFAEACREDTVVITTDRALNPMHGWELRNSMDVANPSLLGSTGYINVLKKKIK